MSIRKSLAAGVFATCVAVAAPSTSVQAQMLSTPKALVIAGGGGGAQSKGNASSAGRNGQTGTAGSAGTGGGAGNGGTGGSGGQGGDFRMLGSPFIYNGGGGAGLYSDGGSGPTPNRDATGGKGAPSFAGGAAVAGSGVGLGGFGGGGGGNNGAGGGGGYSGGGGGSSDSGVGGGGGSFVDASLTPVTTTLNPLSTTSYFGTGANGQISIVDLSDLRSFRFDYTGTQASFTFDTTGLYSIFVSGAQGGSAATDTGGSFGGIGASIGAEGMFTAGSTLSLVVGGGGASVSTDRGGGAGGGGGSFVFLTSIGQPATAVPEPAAWAMMLVGFGAIGGTVRYRRRAATVSLA